MEKLVARIKNMSEEELEYLNKNKDPNVRFFNAKFKRQTWFSQPTIPLKVLSTSCETCKVGKPCHVHGLNPLGNYSGCVKCRGRACTEHGQYRLSVVEED